ncbi:MAG: hypothetical protein KDC52_11450 [Ignavibacteriae bacterium]|nr:hypothetical protein [Ignavibacteriota bacterium]
MFRIVKIYFLPLMIFPAIIFSQSRQSASVDIKIRIIKSMSISVNKSQNVNDSSLEKLADDKIEKGKRSILVDLKNKNVINNKIESSQVIPRLMIQTENSKNSILLNSINELKNLKDDEKLSFLFAGTIEKKFDSNNLAVTIVY